MPALGLRYGSLEDFQAYSGRRHFFTLIYYISDNLLLLSLSLSELSGSQG